MPEGCVTKVFGRYYTVKCEGEKYNSVLRGRLKKDKRLRRFSEAAAVGDIVEVSLNDDGSGVIEEVKERTTVFSRKDRGHKKEDLIAANIDQILVIQAFYDPPLNLRFVDRIMVRGEKEGVPVILCVNKSDLAEAGDEDAVMHYYHAAGVEVLVVSAMEGEGLDALKKATYGKRSILVGYSGVGKSSLLNSIYPGLDLRTSDISESSRKGRHTTTNVEMIEIDDSTAIIDTPGVREFGLTDIEPEELGNLFHEFREAGECRFSPCSHDHEPGCRVKELVEQGEIPEERYISYLNILASLREYYANMY